MNKDIMIDRIEVLSTQKGISKTKALTESGAGKDFISNIKKGQTPSIGKIQKISNYFGVSTDYILGNDILKQPVITVPPKQFTRGKLKGYKGVPKIARTPEQILASAAKSMSTTSSTTIDVNNPKVANAYNNLSEDKQLEVQAYIMKLKNQKEPT